MRRLILAGLLLAAGPALADEASAVAAVRAQARVIEAQLDSGGNLYAVVKNQNLNWDQFAGYLCNVVRPHHARVFKVRVVDVTSLGPGKPPAAWKTLGGASCGR